MGKRLEKTATQMPMPFMGGQLRNPSGEGQNVEQEEAIREQACISEEQTVISEQTGIREKTDISEEQTGVSEEKEEERMPFVWRTAMCTCTTWKRCWPIATAT